MRAAQLEQTQTALTAPRGEDPQIGGVADPGVARVARQEPSYRGLLPALLDGDTADSERHDVLLHDPHPNGVGDQASTRQPHECYPGPRRCRSGAALLPVP